jgi:hypothetical protein
VKLRLLPDAEIKQRTDALLRTMLNTAPGPYTPKPKMKRRARK